MTETENHALLDQAQTVLDDSVANGHPNLTTYQRTLHARNTPINYIVDQGEEVRDMAKLFVTRTVPSTGVTERLITVTAAQGLIHGYDFSGPQPIPLSESLSPKESTYPQADVSALMKALEEKDLNSWELFEAMMRKPTSSETIRHMTFDEADETGVIIGDKVVRTYNGRETEQRATSIVIYDKNGALIQLGRNNNDGTLFTQIKRPVIATSILDRTRSLLASKTVSRKTTMRSA